MTYVKITKDEVVDRAVESKAVWLAMQSYMRGEINLESLGAAVQCEMSNAREYLEDQVASACDEMPYRGEGEEYDYK